MKALHLLTCAVCVAAVRNGTALTVDDRVPGGNARVVAVDEAKGVVDLAPDFRDSTNGWFYVSFRVCGAQGRRIRFRFEPGAARLAKTGPAVSADGGLTWRFLNADKADSPSDRFDYAFGPDEREVRFATSIPYLESNWRAFLRTLEGDVRVEPGVLCASQSGRRNAEILRIRPDAPGKARWQFVFTARHHSCECTASWVLEGLVQEALADTPEGRWIRANAECAFVPFMDKDGVEDGDQGKERAPWDPNRDYLRGRYHTVRAVKALVEEASRAGRRIWFADLHAPWIRDAEHDHFYSLGPRQGPQENRWNIWRDELERAQRGAALRYDRRWDIAWGRPWNRFLPAEEKARLLNAKNWAMDLPGMFTAYTVEHGYGLCGGVFSEAAARELGRNQMKAAVRTILRDAEGKVETCDVLVYGGTPAGVTAAIAAQRRGRRTILIDPSPRIGGLTTGGLGQTDIGAKRCYSGLARRFYREIKAWYADPAHWTRERREGFKGDGWHCWPDLPSDDDTMWTFEPHVALEILERWIAEAKLDVRRHVRLDRNPGATVKDPVTRRITSVRTEDGRTFRALAYVDATYEGDLMAAAGVPYRVGREDNAVHGETVDGVRPADSPKHQFVKGVDPYRTRGDPSSGLLPGVEGAPTEPVGRGDRRVQAYCYRLCLTDDPGNLVPFARPPNYDERDFELLFRNYEAGEKAVAYFTCPMPNRKTDANSSGGFSFDCVGWNYGYPEASYPERDRIEGWHRYWQQGLMWSLANHPRVPAAVREQVSRWGLARDEFTETGNWPGQLYVREARRMVGEYVVTEADVRGDRVAPEPHVATGSYGMDSHHSRRVVVDGMVRNEGDLQDYRRIRLYPIPLAAMRPKREDCANLLVPICLSASHAAYGSIRMEPNFFQLGEAAGEAAADDALGFQGAGSR